MVLKLTLAQGTGSEVASLIIPLPANYFLLTPEQIATQFVEPYLPNLVNDGFLSLGCAVSQRVSINKGYGPV